MSLGDFPSISGNIPYRTPTGVLLPSAGRVVAYVRATPLNDADQALETLRVPTLSAALNKVVSGRNDIILVGQGHTETVSSATYLSALVAGTQIIGLGQGTSRPTFTFGAVAAQWLVAVANVTFQNLLLNMGGGADVTLAIDITGANCSFVGCEFITAASSTSRATTVLRLSAGATDFLFDGNTMRGTNGANSCVDCILVNATVARPVFRRNRIHTGVTVTTVGLIRFAAIATECVVENNSFWATTASSATILDFDSAATGVASNNRARIMSNQAAGTGFTVGTSGFVFNENYVSGVVDTSGYLSPAADT